MSALRDVWERVRWFDLVMVYTAFVVTLLLFVIVGFPWEW